MAQPYDSFVRLPESTGAETPYTAASTITSEDFELRALIRMPSYANDARVYIAGQGTSAVGGWHWSIETSGLVRFSWFTSVGSNYVTSGSGVPLDGIVAAGGWIWLRITRVGTSIDWWAASVANAEIGTWTSLRATVTETESLLAYTDNGVGIKKFHGGATPAATPVLDVDFARVLITRGSTLVRDFDPSRATAGEPGTFTGPDSETWTFNGTGYEVFHAGTAVTLSPDGTVSSSGIEDQAAGTTNLHEAIDDSPDSSDGDTTYLVNSGSASGSAWVTLSNTPADFGSMTTVSVRVRARRT